MSYVKAVACQDKEASVKTYGGQEGYVFLHMYFALKRSNFEDTGPGKREKILRTSSRDIVLQNNVSYR